MMHVKSTPVGHTECVIQIEVVKVQKSGCAGLQSARSILRSQK